jgi:hypothetical protein
MNRQSGLRRFKRMRMKQEGVTFTERVQYAVRTGRKVAPVIFEADQKKEKR